MIRTFRGPMGSCSELTEEGPLVVGLVKPDPATSAMVVESGSSAGEQVTFMVDTGARDSFVDIRIAKKLGLRCVGELRVWTLGGGADCPLYAATIILPMDLEGGGSEMTTMPFELAGVVGEQTGLVRSGLLGRNFLSYFQLAYDGPRGKFGMMTDHDWGMDY